MTVTATGTRNAGDDAAIPQNRPTIRLERVSKIYGVGDTTVHALREVDLTVLPGEYLAIMGASGSGKSTLMNIVGCLDAPTHGRYLLDGIDVRDLDEDQLAFIRNRKIGFIFQSFNLIPRMTAAANVELPLVHAGIDVRARRALALEALAKVGLADRSGHLPSELSGGQQQRVAVARAIATDPVLLLADEPTGALDSRATGELLDLFDELSAAGRTILVITHEHEVAQRARRIAVMRDGSIVSDAWNLAQPESAPGPAQLSSGAPARDRQPGVPGPRSGSVLEAGTAAGQDFRP